MSSRPFALLFGMKSRISLATPDTLYLSEYHIDARVVQSGQSHLSAPLQPFGVRRDATVDLSETKQYMELQLRNEVVNKCTDHLVVQMPRS